MEKGIRLAMHNARCRSDGTVFDVRHNDRTHASASVVSDSSKDRFYVISFDDPNGRCRRVEGGRSQLRDYELSVYRELFSSRLDAQNRRYREHGNYGRVKSIEDVYTNKRTCPEEVYLAIGKMGQDVSYSDFRACVNDYLDECNTRYPQMRLLDIAFHRDERGQMHAHLRRVYVANSDEGCYPSERAALEQMGVELVHPELAPSRINTRKAKMTADLRSAWIDICREHGFDVIDIPEHPGKETLNKERYVYKKLRAENERLRAKANAAQRAYNALSKKYRDTYGVDMDAETVSLLSLLMDAVQEDEPENYF